MTNGDKRRKKMTYLMHGYHTSNKNGTDEHMKGTDSKNATTLATLPRNFWCCGLLPFRLHAGLGTDRQGSVSLS